MSPCVVTVYDRDEGMLRSDDFLGSAVVPWATLYPARGTEHAANNVTLQLGGKSAKGSITVSCALPAAAAPRGCDSRPT